MYALADLFLYYANEESDDVISGFSKTAENSIKNNSRNIRAVLFKLGTRNVQVRQVFKGLKYNVHI